MTLPASGAISMRDINVEMGLPATQTISLNDTNIKSLVNNATDLNSYHGKARSTGNVTTQTSGSWTVPAGVTSVTVTCIGGGGGASNAAWTGYYGGFVGGGAAGSNGQTVTTSISVSGGQIINYTVGAGGLQCQTTANGGPGSPGGDTTFSTVTATGGAGGVYGNAATAPYQQYGKGGNAVSNSYGANEPGQPGAITYVW